MFSHHFRLGVSQIESQLVGMGFVAITQMIREIVDSSAKLSRIELGRKDVIIKEKKSIVAVLILNTSDYSPFFNDKLEELIDYFEKLFELQQQISLETCVCLEDYAMTSELVSLIFNDRPTRVLEIIPLIFKSIRSRNTVFSRKEKNLLTSLISSTYSDH
ncbi:MAG: hypothetical protein JSV04_03330 [Candidatus Heimdallarchaeota archaeon]|nr:MAG: hypothetical protein JSV04_03330 [Candidatus Heimdallarchaeota archaeon]